MPSSPRLVLVSNRLPVTVKLDRGEVTVAQSAGGLATGLRGPHEQSGGPWVGWPGEVSRMTPPQRERLDAHLAGLHCVPVHLTSAEVTKYYDGFSNSVLWPLFHYLLDRIPPTSQEWEVYRSVNERFADVVASTYQPGDLIWVHDYQLTLLPGMLRARLPAATIGFFLHIPFPASEVLRILPWRERVLEGMLGADLIGFHTYSYRSHFASSALRILGIATSEGDRVYVDGREIRLGVFPMGVDTQTFAAMAEDPDVVAEVATIREKARGERILLGIDRLDYTKGIQRRLLAFERLLQREPKWRGRVRLVQVCVPSRDKVPSYQTYRRQVNELVGQINGTYSTVDWVPIHYVYQPLNERQVVALYRAADVMLVTPLRDGMNLVAKEFVTARTDGDGVLVLSEFAGAAVEMGEALQVNPYDTDSMAQTYSEALLMPEDERRLRMGALRQRIASRDVHHWARSFIEALGGVPTDGARPRTTLSSPEELATLTARLRSAERLLLLLDYDGTLVPFARAPDLAAPDRELRDLLKALAGRAGTLVHIVSGRRRDPLERWLGDLPIGLHAEHGYWSRMAPGKPWSAMPDVDVSWKAAVRRILDEAVNTTPGALVEEKTATLAWHWRMAEPELGSQRAEALWARLERETRGGGAELLRGDKVIEVRPRGVSKATVLDRVRAGLELPRMTVAAMGDDWTDEECFRALPPEAIAIGVGYRTTIAAYRVPSPRAARALLAGIVAP